MGATRRGAAATVLLAASLAMAAPAAGGTVGYGLRLGINLANVHGNFTELVEPKMRMGVEVGAFVDYTMTSVLAIQLDADYVGKGATLESEETDASGNPIGSFDTHLEFEYIEVPLMLRATFRPWGAEGLRPYLIGGPTMSILMHGEIDNDEDLGLSDEDVTDDLKGLLWGVTGGVGLGFSSGFGVEARYRTDFDDLWDTDGSFDSINHGYSLTFVLSR